MSTLPALPSPQIYADLLTSFAGRLEGWWKYFGLRKPPYADLRRYFISVYLRYCDVTNVFHFLRKKKRLIDAFHFLDIKQVIKVVPTILVNDRLLR